MPKIRVSRAKNLRKIMRRIERLPREVQIELKKQAIEEAGKEILFQAGEVNYGFRDRTGDLRSTIRLGRPKSTRYGVQIPIIAGRKHPGKGDYAGFVELGTEKMFAKSFLRRAIREGGINALYVFQTELGKILSRLRGI